MGKISKKNKNNIEPCVWDSLHDLELMLDSFEKYQFETILEKVGYKIFIRIKVMKLLTVRKNM